ncbi:MAG TPA: YebC/PmpR family DNA-binding transcriptional regulator [Kiritimatiellia bacterium]|nr:YebC/PmpR family DNA-binding transcriptional regulator [Kiritimatiellia bacterium]HPS09706.1 YebC/PmpR family DNA-binding transcriptional regulator [Kiritimatiellia bacterium]
MSGHNKWSTIKHKKGAADAKRGKIFSKIAKEMTIVAKAGGGDPGSNPTLRTLISKAKAVNMPNDNIDRAIKKGTGELAADILEEITYEGYAQGGVGLVVKVLTDNKNRAAAEVRNIFKKSGSDFAGLGSVSRSFERKGTIMIPAADGVTEDGLMEIVLGAGADDLIAEEGGFTVTCQPAAFSEVCAALEAAKIAIDQENSQVGLVALTPVPVSDVAVAKAVNKFIAALEEHDDVQDVYTNMEMDDAVAAQLEDE